MTKKEWLKKVHGIGNGNGRGRISREGHRLIAEAADNGMTWDDAPSVVAAKTKTKVSKPKGDKPVKPVITEEYNPAEVRKWARDNGHEVSARGRIDSVIVQAYLDATPKAERAEKDDNSKDTRPSVPRRYPEGTTFTVAFTDYKGNPRSTVMNDRTACMGCGVSLAICFCERPGPVALGMEDMSKPVTVTPNLPRDTK